MFTKKLIYLLCTTQVLLFGSATGYASAENIDPATTPGGTLGKITRFIEVSPVIYRGSRASSDEDRVLLLNKGIKTIINLQGEPRERTSVYGDREFARTHGMNFIHAPLHSEWFYLGSVPLPKIPFSPINEASIIKALKATMDPTLQPVYVHCSHGKDRTGLVIALYRVFVEGMDKDQAFHEMRSIGYTPFEFMIGKYYKENAYIGSPLWRKLFIASYASRSR